MYPLGQGSECDPDKSHGAQNDYATFDDAGDHQYGHKPLRSGCRGPAGAPMKRNSVCPAQSK